MFFKSRGQSITVKLCFFLHLRELCHISAQSILAHQVHWSLSVHFLSPVSAQHIHNISLIILQHPFKAFPLVLAEREGVHRHSVLVCVDITDLLDITDLPQSLAVGGSRLCVGSRPRPRETAVSMADSGLFTI